MGRLRKTPSYQLTEKGDKFVLLIPIAVSVVLSAFFESLMIYVLLLGVFITIALYIYMWKTEKGAFHKSLYYWNSPEVVLGKSPSEREKIDIDYIKNDFDKELAKAKNRLKAKRKLEVIKYVDEIELLFKNHIKRDSLFEKFIKGKKEIEDLDLNFIYKLENILNEIIRKENYDLEDKIELIKEEV